MGAPWPHNVTAQLQPPITKEALRRSWLRDEGVLFKSAALVYEVFSYVIAWRKRKGRKFYPSYATERKARAVDEGTEELMRHDRLCGYRSSNSRLYLTARAHSKQVAVQRV